MSSEKIGNGREEKIVLSHWRADRLQKKEGWAMDQPTEKKGRRRSVNQLKDG